MRRAPPEGERSRPVGGRPVPQTVYPGRGRTGAFSSPSMLPFAWRGFSHRRLPTKLFTARHAIDRRRAYRRRLPRRRRAQSGGRSIGPFTCGFPDRTARVRAVGGPDRRRRQRPRENRGSSKNSSAGQRLTFANSDLPGGRDPVDGFLFGKKRGYCEYFASSFAVLLRLAGVPARLVGGYYGGEYNELGGYYLVTQDDAHVWVEALAGGRWVRIDPEPARAKCRATLGASRSPHWGPAGGFSSGPITSGTGRSSPTISAASCRSCAWRRSSSARAWAPRIWRALLVVVGLAAGAAGAIWLVWRMLWVSREEKILRRFLRRVARRYGVEAVRESLGLREIAERLDDPWCREFAEIYGGAVYRDRRLTGRERRRLAEVIRRIGGRPGRTGNQA